MKRAHRPFHPLWLLVTALVLLFAACAPQPPEGFSLSLSSDSVVLAPSGSSSVTVRIEQLSGSQTVGVLLDLEGLPAGVNVDFSSNPASTESVVTLTAAGDASPGEYAVTVSGNTGELESSARLNVRIEAGPQPEPPTFEVDPTVVPPVETIPGLDGGAPRPVDAIVDEHGNQASFVADELLVTTSDRAALDALLGRWQGTVLRSFDPAAAGLDDLMPIYLVRVETTAANAAQLAADLEAIGAQGAGGHRVSSERALDLLGVAAGEARSGLTVGLNWLFEPQEIARNSTVEAASASGGSGYTPNSFTWPYMRSGSVQDIGVTDAWKALLAVGQLRNFGPALRFAVIDGGFAPDADFAPGLVLPAGATGIPNPWTCSGGNPCPWHGTNVFGAGMGLPDNGYGAAGPAGPVAQPVLVQTPSSSVGAIIEFVLDTLRDTLSARPRILNLSASSSIPAIGAVFANPILDAFARSLRRSGILVFASAGNSNTNVDAEDCFIVCWEEATIVPCELDAVICVGGLAWDSTAKAAGSSYGRDAGGGTVDIFGPYQVWVGPDPAAASATQAQLKSGTSFSSPFVAGVAALIWAADPTLSANQVERILIDSAHTGSSDPRVPRWVNARAAVLTALGNDVPPFVEITGPADGSTFSRGSDFIPFVASAFDVDGPLPSITWFSSLTSAPIGTGTAFSLRDLPAGRQTVTVRVRDEDGNEASDAVTITVTNDPPTVAILQPRPGGSRPRFISGQAIELFASSTDPNNAPDFELADSQVSWQVGGFRASGHRATIPAGTLAPGRHTIVFRGSDGEFGASASVEIEVIEPIGGVPHAEILAPADGAVLRARTFDRDRNDYFLEVRFQASATDDEDGTLNGQTMFWTITNQRTGRSSSLCTPLPGAPGIPRIDCDDFSSRLYAGGGTGTSTRYLITLQVYDSDGNPAAPVYILIEVRAPDLI